MPNWSYNNLRITGEEEILNEFYNEALRPNQNGDITFKFSNIFPMPDRIRNTISPSSSAKGVKWINADKQSIREDHISGILGEESNVDLIPCENNTDEKCKELKEQFGTDNWYDWNIMTYGTKWDVEVHEDSYHKSAIAFNCNFDTAWSPPDIFLYNLQKKFSNLNINLSYDLEGSDTCGVFETVRTDGKAQIEHSEADVEYKSEDGRDVYYSSDDGEWHYKEDKEICEDVIRVNPFYEN